MRQVGSWLCVLALALTLSGETMTSAVAAPRSANRSATRSATPDLTGTWAVVNTSGPGASGTLIITNGRNGAFDGTGRVPSRGVPAGVPILTIKRG